MAHSKHASFHCCGQDIASITAHLERMVLLDVDTANVHETLDSTLAGRDFISHVPPDFCAHVSGTILDWDAWTTHSQPIPNASLHVTYMRTSVDLKYGSAVTHLQGLRRGVGEGIEIGIAAEYRWYAERDGKWMLMRYVGIKGPHSGL